MRGESQEWNIVNNGGQNVEQPKRQEGFAVEADLDIILKNINRYDCPIYLDPQRATFNDVAIHAQLRQRLQIGTIEKHLRYARFMETHKVPVDFRNPTFENFVRHMDYREQIEQATPYALEHE